MRAWILDSSAIIEAKRQVPAGHQWRLFKQLEEMVEAAEVYFPKQVTAELSQQRHTDVPEAWALDVGPKVATSYSPALATVQKVMAIAGDVVDADAEIERGDPYVLAQAIELSSEFDVCIVTEDVVDRQPIKVSMASACGRLNLQWCRLADFLAGIGFATEALVSLNGHCWVLVIAEVPGPRPRQPFGLRCETSSELGSR